MQSPPFPPNHLTDNSPRQIQFAPRRRARASVLWTALLLLAFATPLFAEYRFLGSAVRAERGPASLTVECEEGHRLRVEFLMFEIIRVTLQRADRDEPLLEYPLAERYWSTVHLQFTENERAYILGSGTLEAEITKHPCRVTIRDRSGNVLCRDDSSMGMGWDCSEVRCWKTITPDDKFYGLGLKVGDLNKRGREWVMWNSDVPGYTWQTDPIYQSIPFFVGIHDGQAFGIYFNNSYRTRFNMGAGNLRYYSFSADDGPLDYFFIGGPRVPDVVGRYTALTGRISMPPLWALGYQQCRWSYFPDQEVRRLAETFREKRIGADVIYLDIHHMDGYRVFTWDSSRFPNPSGLLSDLSKMGFHVVTIVDPGVKVDTNYAIAREGLQGDHFVKYPDGQLYVGEVWPGPSYFPDFSKNETRTWWGDHVGQWLKSGVSGIWNDMNEPACWGQAFPTETVWNDEGRISDHKKMHNLFGLLMAQATYEGALRNLPNKRPFILTRAGFAGEQRYSAVWTGDNVASEDHLALGIRQLQNLGLSGVPFVGTDIGGFIGTPSPELYARWIEVGALSPLCRTHSEYNSSDQEPWSFGERTEEISRSFIEMRYRMIPYLYSLFHQSSLNGAPIWKPLFWNDQDDPKTFEWAYQHQFFVGDKLLAAPVTRVGQYTQKVYLPKGRWLDFRTETVYEGPREVIVDAPLDWLPSFLREGAIIPLRDPVQYTSEKPISLLTLHVFPADTESRFTLYEDDGESFDYRGGEYRLTEWACVREGGDVQLWQTRPRDAYSVPARMTDVILHDCARPHSVTLDGKALRETADGTGFSYDADKRILTVRLDSDQSRWRLTVR